MNPWVALIIGLLVGWVLEWVIDWLYWRRRATPPAAPLTLAAAGSTAQAELADLRATLESLRTENGRLQTDLSAAGTRIQQQQEDAETLRAEVARLSAPPEPPPAPAPPPRRDPLVDINGIGPVYEQRLFAAGILTFAALADQSPERLREIVEAKDWQDVDLAAWIAEARERAAGESAGEA